MPPHVPTLERDLTTPDPSLTTLGRDSTTLEPDLTTPDPSLTTLGRDSTTLEPDLTTPDLILLQMKPPTRNLMALSMLLLPAGSQYCCWNSDSSLVAVSSDYYRAVMVFDVQKKQQVGLLMDLTAASVGLAMCERCSLESACDSTSLDQCCICQTTDRLNFSSVLCTSGVMCHSYSPTCGSPCAHSTTLFVQPWGLVTGMTVLSDWTVGCSTRGYQS